MSAAWINKLNESDSRLYKEEILRQALTSATLGSEISITFLTLLRICYDPFITFGIKQIPKTSEITDAENPVREYAELLQNLITRTLSGNEARDAIEQISHRFDSEEWNTFYAPVLRRDMRAGISEKTINKVCKDTQYEVPVFSCQLATNCENRPEMKGQKRLERKLDGVRLLLFVYVANSEVVGTTAYSRNGKPFENFSSIEEQIRQAGPTILASRHKAITGLLSNTLMRGFVLDGEVMSSSFQALMKQARRKENVDANDSIFHVFDIIPLEDFRSGYWNASQYTRNKLLESMQSAFDQMPNVELLSHLNVDLDTLEGRNQLDRYSTDAVEAGYEGVVIKDIEAPYLCKRSTNWLKFKPVLTVDLTVVAIEEGAGKHSGRLGALVCEGYENGKFIRVNVGSGFTDIQRNEIWQDKLSVIGQIVEVKADCITKSQQQQNSEDSEDDDEYSLRFPRFERFRGFSVGEKF